MPSLLRVEIENYDVYVRSNLDPCRAARWVEKVETLWYLKRHVEVATAANGENLSSLNFGGLSLSFTALQSFSRVPHKCGEAAQGALVDAQLSCEVRVNSGALLIYRCAPKRQVLQVT